MALNKTQQGWVKSAAAATGYAFAVLAALIDKESNGQFAWDVNGKKRLALNIEPHRFYKYLALYAPDKLKEAVSTGLAAKKRGVIKVPGSYGGRYAMLDRMIALHYEAAYMSVSFGVGQIMGENYKAMGGYASAEQMFAEAETGGGPAQIEQIVKFIATKPELITAMHDEDPKQIAYYYNGPAYKQNHYDTELTRLIELYGAGLTPTVIDPADAADVQAITALGYASVEQFQAENGLKSDGKIGQITKAKIAEVKAARKQVKNAPVKVVGVIAGAVTGTATAGVAVATNTQTIADTVQSVQDTVTPVVEIVQKVSVLGPALAVLVVLLIVGGGISYAIWQHNRKAV